MGLSLPRAAIMRTAKRSLNLNFGNAGEISVLWRALWGEAMGKDFDNAIIVVTGASTGLGRAIAVETARRGAKAVVINFARSAKEAEETAGLARAQGAEAAVVQADVADDGGCRRIAKAAEGFGRIDALFNNAGITKFAPTHAALDAVSPDDFIRLYQVNVVGAFQMTRAARALLEAAPPPAAIVNVSSIAAAIGIGSCAACA